MAGTNSGWISRCVLATPSGLRTDCQNAAVDTPRHGAWQVTHPGRSVWLVPLVFAMTAVVLAIIPAQVRGSAVQASTYGDLGPWVTLLDRLAAASMVAGGIVRLVRGPAPSRRSARDGRRVAVADARGRRLAGREPALRSHRGAPRSRGCHSCWRVCSRTSSRRVAASAPMADGRCPDRGHGHRHGRLRVGLRPPQGPTCWADCSGAPLVDLDSTAAVRTAQVLVALAVRWRRSCWPWSRGAGSPPMPASATHPGRSWRRRARATRSATLVLAAMIALRLTGRPAIRGSVPAEHPARDEFALVFVLRGLALVALRPRADLASAGRSAAPPPGSDASPRHWRPRPRPGRWRQRSGSRSGDPSLRVLYWLDHAGVMVDASGPPADRAPDPASASSGHVHRARRPARGTGRERVPLRHPGAAAGAGCGGSRGRRQRAAAGGGAVPDRPVACRRECVSWSSRDAERRRLERDLHDGAQQRLLAISYDLRVARGAAVSEGDPDLVARLDRRVRRTSRPRWRSCGSWPTASIPRS